MLAIHCDSRRAYWRVERLLPKSRLPENKYSPCSPLLLAGSLQPIDGSALLARTLPGAPFFLAHSCPISGMPRRCDIFDLNGHDVAAA